MFKPAKQTNRFRFKALPTVLGLATATLVMGAVHLESAPQPAFEQRWQYDMAKPMQLHDVNRSSKGNREIVEQAAPSRAGALLQFRVPGKAQTSVAARLSSTGNVQKNAPTVQPVEARETRQLVACEPVVSVLTELARRIEPGRCDT